MSRHKNSHSRKHSRIQGYDYTQPGYYAVTICTHHKQHLFGAIISDMHVLNECGWVAQRNWRNITEHFPHVRLDTWIFMPNHMHGILEIFHKPHNEYTPEGFSRPVKGSLSTIIRSYKSSVTRDFRQYFPTDGPIWQNGFYESVIDEEKYLNNIRQYILNNPMNWPKDRFYTTAK